MNPKHAFKPAVSDNSLETRVVLSTIGPRGPIAFGGNPPSYFNPTHNTVNPGNLRGPIAFGSLAHPPKA